MTADPETTQKLPRRPLGDTPGITGPSPEWPWLSAFLFAVGLGVPPGPLSVSLRAVAGVLLFVHLVRSVHYRRKTGQGWWLLWRR